MSNISSDAAEPDWGLALFRNSVRMENIELEPTGNMGEWRVLLMGIQVGSVSWPRLCWSLEFRGHSVDGPLLDSQWAVPRVKIALLAPLSALVDRAVFEEDCKREWLKSRVRGTDEFRFPWLPGGSQ